MFTEQYYLKGMGLDLGHMEVGENIVSVIIKCTASRGDRHGAADFVIITSFQLWLGC